MQQKGARLGYGLICNHAFVDGNKRIGAHAMLLFLSLNGIELEYTQNELSDMILDVAAGNLRFEDMVKWIIKHQVSNGAGRKRLHRFSYPWRTP